MTVAQNTVEQFIEQKSEIIQKSAGGYSYCPLVAAIFSRCVIK